MPLSRRKARVIHNAVTVVCRHVSQIMRQPPSWSTMTEQELWEELAACILGSRVSHAVTYAAVGALRHANLVRPRISARGRNYDQYERACVIELQRSVHIDELTGRALRYPYPALRANHLRRSAEVVLRGDGSIGAMIQGFLSVYEARAHLASMLPGLGPKQASLFLRNIGYADDLAVLDVHVLRYLEWVGLNAPGVSYPRGLSEYEQIEDVFREHAKCMGYSVGHLDYAVWVVSRVAVREMVV